MPSVQRGPIDFSGDGLVGIKYVARLGWFIIYPLTHHPRNLIGPRWTLGMRAIRIQIEFQTLFQWKNTQDRGEKSCHNKLLLRLNFNSLFIVFWRKGYIYAFNAYYGPTLGGTFHFFIIFFYKILFY